MHLGKYRAVTAREGHPGQKAIPAHPASLLQPTQPQHELCLGKIQHDGVVSVAKRLAVLVCEIGTTMPKLRDEMLVCLLVR